jgi:hypothetical protein
MPNYAVIENGKVVNMCIAEPEDIKPDNWVLCEVGGIDWDYVNGQFVDNRPVPEVVTLPAPTKEQLLAQLQAIQEQIQSLT